MGEDFSFTMAPLLRALLEDDAASFIPMDLRTALLSASSRQCESCINANAAQLLRQEHFEGLQQGLPLYRYLARVLLKGDEVLQTKTNVLELLGLFKETMSCVKHRLHVEEPFFSQLKDGTKTVEGRCSTDTYNSIKRGDMILFNDVLILIVENVIHYRSFKEMLESEGLDVVLPGVSSIAEGVLIYRRFYSEEKEIAEGVIGIHLRSFYEEKQPLVVTGNILREIGVKELKSLTCSIVQAIAYT